MTLLILAALVFVFGHVALAALPVRRAVEGAVGRIGFLAGYSVFALISLVWLVMAYNAASQASFVMLWPTAPALIHPAALLVLLGFLFGVVGWLTPGVTSIVGDEERPLPGINRITRHPTLWGVLLWALGHFLANGDLASSVFFGSFALLAALGMWHIDHRRARTLGAQWDDIAAHSSVWPFLALIQRRTTMDWRGIGLVRPFLALFAYGVMLVLHPWLFGVDVLAWFGVTLPVL